MQSAVLENHQSEILTMKSEPGTYALILRSRSRRTGVQVGRLGQIKIEPGYYIYIGSAFGPGGVKARVLRHIRTNKQNRWHIDYLSKYLTPLGAWYSHDSNHLEHLWAQELSNMSGMTSIEGFGSTDCKCFSHLLYSSKVPDLNLFSKIAGCEVESWSFRPDA